MREPLDEEDDLSEVEALLLRGEVDRAVSLILFERALSSNEPVCDGCGRLVDHTSWCPLRYWR